MQRTIVIEQRFRTNEREGIAVYVSTLDEQLTLREAVFNACVDANVHNAASVFDNCKSTEIGGSVVHFFVGVDHD